MSYDLTNSFMGYKMICAHLNECLDFLIKVGEIIMENWVSVVCALFSGIIGSLLTVYLSHRYERGVCRRVAYAVVFSLQREIEVGIRLIEETKAGKRDHVGQLPTNGWMSLQNILLDRNILEAIIRYGNGGKVKDPRIGSTWGDKRFEPYKIEEVLSHTKNYFCYIVPNFKDITPRHFENPNTISELYVGACNVNMSLKKILDGLS